MERLGSNRWEGENLADYLYGTTKRFLKIFGLKNIDALPPIQIDTLEDGPIEHSPNEDLSTSKKELVVSNTVSSSRRD